MLYATIRAFHIGRNRNGSAVTQEAAKNCLSGIKYKPILASIVTDEESGEEDFHAHDMQIDDDGNVTYIEKQVGCFTAKDPYIQFDEDHQKSYVYAQCAIPRDYTHAANIIERKGGTKVSVELLVNACSYNAKEKYLELSDIEVAGCCLLGEDVGEGMVGSKLQLEDFAYSEPEPTINFSEDQMNSLINSFKELQKTLEGLNKNSRKEENTMENENVNLNEQNQNEENTQTQENLNEENTQTEENAQTQENSQTENQPEENENTSSEEENYSIHREGTRDGLNYSVNFEVSHEDIRYALYNLISSWDEEDNDWYFIDKVYDGKFIASGFWSNQIWGSKYTVDGDNVNLDGERYALHAEYVTDEELESLNEMRANYSSLQETVAKYELAELNAQRDEILNSDKYAEYADTNEFKTLRENKENYSLDELKTQCELAFAAQFDGAKPKKQNFAEEEPKDQPKKQPKVFTFLHRDDNTNDFLNGLMGRK